MVLLAKGPVEVIVIEHVLCLLRLDIESEQLAQLLFPAGTPGIEAAQHVAERQFRVHGARIDRKAGALHRKPAFGFRQSKLVPTIDVPSRDFS